MPYKQLSKDNKEMFMREIEEMGTKVLEKKKENIKLSMNAKEIKNSIRVAIDDQNQKILAAQIEIADLTFDMENNVSLRGLHNKFVQNEEDIKRHENNIKVRQDQIRNGVLENPSRDEKARKQQGKIEE